MEDKMIDVSALTKVTVDGVEYKAVENWGCDLCDLQEEGKCDCVVNCGACNRLDSTNVNWVRVDK